MTVTAELKQYEVLPLGVYNAVLMDVEDGGLSEHGSIWVWKFSITKDDFDGTEMSGITSQTYSNFPSKSFKWAKALGHPGNGNFNSDHIVGNLCRLKIDQLEKDEVVRNKILDVLPPGDNQLQMTSEL